MTPTETGRHLYIIQSDVTGAVKVGRSGNPKTRLKQLQTGSPHRLKLLLVVEDGGSGERMLHARLSRWLLKGNGEWFSHDCLPNLPDELYERLPQDDRWWYRSSC